MSRFLETLQAASGDSSKTIDACISIIDYIYVKCSYPRLGKRAFNNNLTQKCLTNALLDHFYEQEPKLVENNNTNNASDNFIDDKVVETIASTLALITSQNPVGAQVFTTKQMIETVLDKAFLLAKSSEAIEDLASFLGNLTSNNPDLKKAILLLMPDDEKAMNFIETILNSFAYAKSSHAVARLASLLCNVVLNFPRDNEQYHRLSEGMFEKLFSENIQLLLQLFAGFSRVTSDDDNDCVYWLCILLTLLLNYDSSNNNNTSSSSSFSSSTTSSNTKKILTTSILSSPEFWNFTFVKACKNISTAESVDKLCSVLVALVGDRSSEKVLARQLLLSPQNETVEGLFCMMKYASRTVEATEWFSYVVFYLCLEDTSRFVVVENENDNSSSNNSSSSLLLSSFVDRFEKELGETAKKDERCRRIHKDALDLMKGASELEYRLKL